MFVALPNSIINKTRNSLYFIIRSEVFQKNNCSMPEILTDLLPPDTVKVLLFIDVNFRGLSKLPGIVGSYICGFIIGTKILWKFCISLDIRFRGFNETRNSPKLALHEL